MFGKNEDPTITALKKTQNELNKKLTLLNEEARRLRGEITQVETAKNDVNSNQTKIDKVLKEITGLQRGIKAELTKLSNQITSITPSATTNSEITDGPPPPPPPQGVPPPPPPLGAKTQQPLPKRTVSPKVEQSLQSKPETPKSFDPNDLNTGRSNLRTRGEKPVENKTPDQIQKEKEEEIKRYQTGNEKKEADIERLLTLVSSLSSKLETEKASQGEYQQAVQNQAELLADLNNKKGALEGKLKTVSVQVGDELTKIKEKMEAEKLVQQEPNTTSIGDAPIPPPPNIPPPPPPNNIPPPPPPPGNITGSKQSKFQGKRESPTAPTEEKKISSSSSAEKPQLDTDAIQQAALAKSQRLEAKEIKDYLVGKLVDTVVKEAMVEEGTMEYMDNQQQLIDLIGEDGYENLKTSMAKSIDEDPNISKEDKQIHIRRARMEDLPVEIATIPHYKDNARLKEAVGQFIDNHLNKNNLLEFSKESRQQETLEKQKQAEAESLERARKKEENDKKIAEEQKLKTLQETKEVQRQLSAMGIKEGVVDTTGVKKAQAEKDEVINSVVSKKPVIQEVDSFLDNIDRELNEKITALQKAEELRVEALKKAELETVTPVVEIPVVEIPVVEAPVVEAPVVEAPVVETPVVETPVVETPVVEAPVVEAPVVEAPVVEAPVVEAPVVETPVAENPVAENPVAENPVAENPVAENPVAERTNKEQARLKLLDATGFNAKLNAIQYVAINLSNQNKPEAALEVFNIFKKLDTYKYEFIKNGDNNELAEKCEKAIEPAVTKNLSEQKSAFGWIKKTINNIVHAITGKPHKEMDINVAKELKEDMKTTLKDIRNKASKEEPEPDNTVSSRHQL